jgi:hypothetical protein
MSAVTTLAAATKIGTNQSDKRTSLIEFRYDYSCNFRRGRTGLATTRRIWVRHEAALSSDS